MKTYYFNLSKKIDKNKMIVVSETRFKRIQNRNEDGCFDTWIADVFPDFATAKESFKQEWFCE